MKNNRLAVILFGPPSGGKGTQATKLSDLGFLHINSGEIIKKSLSEQEMVSVNDGNLTSDETAIVAVDGFILEREDFPKLSVFDGFPRSEHQARWLIGMLSQRHARIIFIHLTGLDRTELDERRRSRGRDDDTDKSFENRIFLYEKYEREVVSYVRHQHHRVSFKDVAANRTEEEIAREIRGIVSTAMVTGNRNFSFPGSLKPTPA